MKSEDERSSNDVTRTELLALECFVGDWRNHGRIDPGSFGPGGEIGGRSTYGWGLGATWLMFHSRLDLPGLGNYEVSGGLTFDPDKSRYVSWAANALGRLIVYEGDWEGGSSLVFVQVFPAPAGLTRVSYEVIDEDSIRMRSDRMAESGAYQTYFETMMERDSGAS